MMTLRLPAIFLAAALAATAVCAQEAAVTNRATELRTEPRPDAAALATLPEGTSVKALERQSGWTRVEANQKTGWVRVFHLRFQSIVARSEDSGGASFLSFLRGSQRAPTTQTATVGIRGLSEEDLKNASPNPEALKKLQSFRADKPAGESFAQEAKLAAVRVDYADGGAEKRGSR
jgi:uncharacterized protein YgiM (DUF1202 family)